MGKFKEMMIEQMDREELKKQADGSFTAVLADGREVVIGMVCGEVCLMVTKDGELLDGDDNIQWFGGDLESAKEYYENEIRKAA